MTIQDRASVNRDWCPFSRQGGVMWNYTKCTAEDRKEKLGRLEETFKRDSDCLKYLAEVQNHINCVQTTIVLLQDLEANILIEMDYAPVNDYVFHVVAIEENGIRNQGRPCKSIRQAVDQYVTWIGEKL